jgi:hypothetical protein
MLFALLAPYDLPASTLLTLRDLLDVYGAQFILRNGTAAGVN